MKTTEELRKDLIALARKNPELAAMIEKINHKVLSWERVALHLYLDIAGDEKPAKQAKNTVKR
jgi:hypothetical protein